jgi:Smg protein
MNENLLDVLLYLFEHYPLGEVHDHGGLRNDLDAAGFLPEEVDDAFTWLRGTDIDRQQLLNEPGDRALRLYSDAERERLSSECQGYILRLQQHGILTGATREIAIDRLLALADEDGEPIEVEQLKWVVMMVLSNQGDPAAYAHMEALMLVEEDGSAH